MSKENNDDLTTDSIPCPPRDEFKESNNSSQPHHINIDPNTKTKPSSFARSKKRSPTAFASVINISNANGVHVGTNLNIYVNKPDNVQQKDNVVTDAIKILFKSPVAVDRKHLTFISLHINEDWRITGRALNYSDGQISQFYEDYTRSGIKEVIYQLLLDWTQNEPDAATVGRLSTILWESNQQDAVKRWSENFINE